MLNCKINSNALFFDSIHQPTFTILHSQSLLLSFKTKMFPYFSSFWLISVQLITIAERSRLYFIKVVVIEFNAKMTLNFWIVKFLSTDLMRDGALVFSLLPLSEEAYVTSLLLLVSSMTLVGAKRENTAVSHKWEVLHFKCLPLSQPNWSWWLNMKQWATKCTPVWQKQSRTLLLKPDNLEFVF